MKINRRKTKPTISLIIIPVVAIILISCGAIGCYIYINRQITTLPAPIESSLAFSPLVIPDNAPGISASDYKYSEVEDGTEIFSYIITVDNDITVSMSEYIQPPEFTEITDYQDQFLINVIQQSATVPTSIGTIYLGEATKLENQQLGVIIDKGLIVFMSPSQNLDETQWREIGDNLKVQTIVSS